MKKKQEVIVRYGGLEFHGLDEFEYNSSGKNVLISITWKSAMTQVAKIREVAVLDRWILYSITKNFWEWIEYAFVLLNSLDFKNRNHYTKEGRCNVFECREQ